MLLGSASMSAQHEIIIMSFLKKNPVGRFCLSTVDVIEFHSRYRSGPLSKTAFRPYILTPSGNAPIPISRHHSTALAMRLYPSQVQWPPPAPHFPPPWPTRTSKLAVPWQYGQLSFTFSLSSLRITWRPTPYGHLCPSRSRARWQYAFLTGLTSWPQR